MASEEHCVKALDRHEKKLSANPRVQGLGITAREGEPFDSNDVAVAVYVEKKLPDEEVPEEHRLPESLEIEEEGETHVVPVRIIEQGPVTLETPGTETPGIETAGIEMPGIESPEDSEE